MQRQLEEAIALGEAGSSARRAAEARAAQAEARAEAVEAASARSAGRGGEGLSQGLELRNARAELAAQEAAVREARELKGYVRCAFGPLRCSLFSPCSLLSMHVKNTLVWCDLASLRQCMVACSLREHMGA